MTVPPLSISVRNVHVEYELFSDRRAAIAERLITRTGTGRSVVRALRGVSFDVREGEAVGVIGSNGSGKSTLCSAVAGLLAPSKGQILVSGEPTLLGVGASLLPRATGYRNIRLGCLALGMSSEEIDALLPELVEFTELGEAIHRPMRTYSSGMRARLAFAIATSIEPKILLIDEGLSVGDRRFKRKSNQRVRALLDRAGTLMMVTHSPGEIRRTCDRVLWIEEGKLMADGGVNEVLEQYVAATDADVPGGTARPGRAVRAGRRASARGRRRQRIRRRLAQPDEPARHR